MGQYLGFVPLGEVLHGALVIRDSSQNPADPGTAPLFRVYDGAGLVAGQTGSLTKLDTGAVTAATNATPISITSAGHGLATGVKVTVSGVGGNAAANTTTTVTVVDPNTFTLDGTTGSGAYTSGGAWHTTGLYQVSITASAGNGYAQGQTYTLLVSASVAGTVLADTFTFIVV